jgi:putative aldouronate transport system permease protein
VVLRNTILLNVYGLVFGFPAPIILSLLLNEVRNRFFKRINQSILYIPHFMSWVILSGIFIQILSPSTGVVNQLISTLGGEPIYFMASDFWWPVVYVVSGIWQGVGWGTIIYLAAISGIDPELYEAARIDGAGRGAQMWHITLPCIKPTISILLILNLGGMLGSSWEKVYTLQNSAVYEVSDVLATYTYRLGILNSQFSFTTAVGLFNSVVSLLLIVAANKITRMIGENNLW